jgi:CPA2 family monovalent cation:H+ antiporter-2
VQAGPRLGVALEASPLARLGRQREASASAPPAHALEDHVIIVGYGHAGRRLAQVLKDTGIPFIILELNPSSVREAEAEGVPIHYGDASRRHILEAAGVLHAKLCVVVINDQAATERVARLARYLNPTLQIFVRTRFFANMERLQHAGADIVVPEELETTVRLFSHVLGAYMVPPEEVERQVGLVRAGDYRVLRGSIQEAHLMVLQGLDEEGLHTRAVAVRDGAPAAGRTLAELALRQHYGLTVLAVRREGRTLGSPAGDFRIQPRDRLVLVGTAAHFAAAAPLFRPPEEAPA